MSYSRNSNRCVIAFALAIVNLIQAPLGLANSGRQPVTPDWRSETLNWNSEASRILSSNSTVDRQTRDRASEAFSRLPLRFEANAGQTDTTVKFFSRGPGYNLFLTPTEAVLKLQSASGGLRSEKFTNLNKSHPPSAKTTTTLPQFPVPNPQSVVRMKLLNAHPSPKMEGVEKLPGKSNYLIGNDPGKWRRNVTSYAKVRYQGVYPGIDLLYYGNQQQLEYDFVVAPRANPDAIRLSFEGIEQMELDATGDLILHTNDGLVRQRKPVIYQELNGGRQEIAGRYTLKSEREVGFELGAYDRNRPLVIDPVLAYSTFLGGGDGEIAIAVAVDNAGNAYAVGETLSLDFPTANALQPKRGEDPNLFASDAFISKFNRDGSALLYSTYLGGGNLDFAFGIKVDRSGSACVVGGTYSNDFPTKNPLQPTLGDEENTPEPGDAFVAKLNAEGSAFVFSTYLGGANWEWGTELDLDRAGNIYLTGFTTSPNFPTKNPLQPSLRGAADAFAAKLSANGSVLVYATYLGGSSEDAGNDVAVDSHGNAYLTGLTISDDFPTANPLQPTRPGELDAYITKLDANGATLGYSTYFGGAGFDYGVSIAVDAVGNAYVAGSTTSTDLPLMNPLQGVLAGSQDVFIAKFNPAGSALRYSTYLGGAQYDELSSLAVDPQGQVYIAGDTFSADFPTLDALQPMPDNFGLGAGRNAFLTVLNANCSGLVYSTYLGGRHNDRAKGITLDAMGNVYVVGESLSEDLPTTPGAFQRVIRSTPSSGSGDAFIIKIVSQRPRIDDDDEDR